MPNKKPVKLPDQKRSNANDSVPSRATNATDNVAKRAVPTSGSLSSPKPPKKR